MDYSKKTHKELLQLCKDRKVAGYSGKKKDELIALLEETQPKSTTKSVIDAAFELDTDSELDTDTDSESVNKETEETEEIEKEIPTNLNETIKIMHGNCLEKMKEIPSDSVHLILCDLPYGTTKCKWDSVIDMDDLWKEYKRILIKPTGVVVLFGQQPFTSKLIASNYEWYKYNWIWKKNKTTQFLLANYRPMKCTEDICVFSPGGAAAASRHKGNMTYNPQGLQPVNIVKKNSEKRIGKMLNQIHHLGPNNKLISNTEYKQSFTNYPTEILEFDIESDTIHETQKPVKLIEYLIRTYSNEGNTVLDNTMGSGTTGIGCINSNRKFIGIELEKKYFDLSQKRLVAALAEASASASASEKEKEKTKENKKSVQIEKVEKIEKENSKPVNKSKK
jgi:site-specific DNA-methyltransferase (adenine-specific)